MSSESAHSLPVGYCRMSSVLGKRSQLACRMLLVGVSLTYIGFVLSRINSSLNQTDIVSISVIMVMTGFVDFFTLRCACSVLRLVFFVFF